jgi:hypothetical protein
VQTLHVQPAVDTAMSIASALGLRVEETVIPQASNKLTVRLLPCDLIARIADVAHQVADFEVEFAKRLAEIGSPVAALEPRVEPRVYVRDGFAVTLWTYCEPVPPREVAPAEYAPLLSACVPACDAWTLRHRISQIESPKRNRLLRAATALLSSLTPTAGYSATHFEA